MKRKKATLLLQDGRTFNGWSFGHDGPSQGEIVFSTAMVGYPESLTDPSYSGQILCVSFPLVGNYGIPEMERDALGLCTRFESEHIHVRGLVISDYSEKYSHWDAVKSLDRWLQEEQVPGICGIDTRALVQLLRDEGAKLGAIVPEGTPYPAAIADPNLENQVAKVSCREIQRYGTGRKRVVLVDCGVKHQIIRCLVNRGIEVVRVPWDYDFNDCDADGIFVSNGPGNPELCAVTVKHLQQALAGDRPIFGICMGNQLMGRAAGASTYKLKYGHRSHNQPVRMNGTDRCFISCSTVSKIRPRQKG
ncbi:MAG: glutamine-hydrolyzing carbamoyl-phosphate synthase small subunit [Bacteroidales bacterium]|nr:glutamine-hydrolyzing carbamoyl-phosphate synthase small subunit [Bacteroidales bacterium]